MMWTIVWIVASAVVFLAAAFIFGQSRVSHAATVRANVAAGKAAPTKSPTKDWLSLVVGIVSLASAVVGLIKAFAPKT